MKLKKAEDRELAPVAPTPPGKSTNPRGGNLMGDLMKAMDTRRHQIDDSNDNDQQTGSGIVWGELQDANDSW